jgi:hypothetical protein
MPIDRQLQAEILRLVGIAVNAPYAASRVQNNDLFEQYVFGLLLAAARLEHGSITYRRANGLIATSLCFRISPGWIYRDGPGYTHALIAFDRKMPVEAHIGIRVRGTSEVEHECDIVALLADHASFCRVNEVSPASKSALVAIECKHLASNTNLNYGRSFVGLARDLSAKHEFFVTNSTSRTVERLLQEQTLKWEHNVRPSLPDISGKLTSAFREVFKGYKAGRWASL